MTDQDVIDFFIDKHRNKIIEARVSKKYLDRNAIDYKNYLDSRYDDDFDKYSEIITRIYYRIDTKPICKICGKPLKFQKFTHPYGKWCSSKCQLSDPEFIKWRTSVTQYDVITEKAKQTNLERYGDPNYRNIEKAKQTNLERYGVENVYQSKDVKNKCRCTKKERYGDPNYRNIEKAKQTNLERYGVEWYLQLNDDKLKRGSDENIEKTKQTNLERYGVEYYFQSSDWKEKNKLICLRKYGVEHYSKTSEFKKKVYNTKKQNGTFNTSKVETKLIKYFIDNNINFKTQYKSDLYPFMCDFYFPDTDSYVEIQGNWTHGNHPFDENNEDDLNILQYWKSKKSKYYNIAINVWSVTDVQKRRTAKLNNIKLFEIFTMNVDNIIYELKINNII